MRLIGTAEPALELACERASTRHCFGKPLINLGGNHTGVRQFAYSFSKIRSMSDDDYPITGASSGLGEAMARSFTTKNR